MVKILNWQILLLTEKQKINSQKDIILIMQAKKLWLLGDGTRTNRDLEALRYMEKKDISYP